MGCAPDLGCFAAAATEPRPSHQPRLLVPPRATPRAMSDKLSRRKVPSQTSRKGSASSLLSRSKSSSSSSSLTAAAPASTAAASPSPSTGSELATTATAAGTALAAETLEVTSEEADYHICPPHFVAYVLPEDGHYIMHTRVVCRTGVMRIFVLTDESILKFSAEGEYKYAHTTAHCTPMPQL